MMPRMPFVQTGATVAFLLFTSAFPAADDPVPWSPVAVPRKETVTERVARLLNRIESGGERDRSDACARLREIGPGLLDILPAMPYGKNAETRRRVLDVMDDIRRDHQLAPADDALEFAVVTDPVWPVPAPGKSRKVRFEILFLGRAKDGPSFYLFDAFSLRWLGPDDRPLDGAWGRNGVNGRYPWTPRLNRGDLFVCSFFETTLHCSVSSAEFTLRGTEGFGGEFMVKGLRAGRHRIFAHAYRPPWKGIKLLSAGTRRWAGNLNSRPATFHIQ